MTTQVLNTIAEAIKNAIMFDEAHTFNVNTNGYDIEVAYSCECRCGFGEYCGAWHEVVSDEIEVLSVWNEDTEAEDDEVKNQLNKIL